MGLIQQHIWDCLKDTINAKSPCPKEVSTSFPWRQWGGEENRRGMGGMDETTIKLQSRSKCYRASLKLNDELVLASEGVIKLHLV